jgi:hypothetical protein
MLKDVYVNRPLRDDVVDMNLLRLSVPSTYMTVPFPLRRLMGLSIPNLCSERIWPFLSLHKSQSGSDLSIL